MALEKRQHRYSTGQLIRRLLAIAWVYRLDCIWSVFLSILLLLLALAGLQFLGLTVDVIRHALDPAQKAPVYPFHLVPPTGWGPLQIVSALSVAIIVQAILRAWLTYAYNMATARLTQGKIVPDLRDRLYNKLQHLSFGFYDKEGSSSIFNRVTGDVQNTRLFVDGVVLQSVNMGLTLLAYFFFMWRIHPRLTVACLSTTAGLWWITHYYSARLRPAYLRNRELYDGLVLNFTETVKGMQTVKGFGAEENRRRGFEAANDLVSGQQKRIFSDLALFAPLTQLLSQTSLVILFAYGGWLYVRGQISLGSGLVVFAGLMQQFNGQVANITTIANSVQQSLASASRVFDVLESSEEVSNRPGALKVSTLQGRIVFDHVSFGYHADTPVLRDISFTVAPGQMVGVFGMTGAGKTTLLNLIPRFYDCQEGRVLVDGRDLRDLDLHSYRRHVGIVYQESFLFSNTVAANIAFGNPHATFEQIEAAARAAAADEFIRAMPHGYETVLGESGVDLSGGQRQRLALARALLTQPPILILDDPTASVDAKTEQEIAASLRHAMEGRTTFVVANRLSLLSLADLILVLEKGRLRQFGSHEELLRAPGPYRDAAVLQFAMAEERESSMGGRASTQSLRAVA